MNDLLVFLGWAYANLPAIVIAAVLFGLVTVFADQHPETADRWAARLYPEWRR